MYDPKVTIHAPQTKNSKNIITLSLTKTLSDVLVDGEDDVAMMNRYRRRKGVAD